jgi:hypothetical protein
LPWCVVPEGPASKYEPAAGGALRPGCWLCTGGAVGTPLAGATAAGAGPWYSGWLGSLLYFSYPAVWPASNSASFSLTLEKSELNVFLPAAYADQRMTSRIPG